MQTIYISGLTDLQKMKLQQEGFVVFLDKNNRASIPLSVTKKLAKHMKVIAEVIEDCCFGAQYRQ